MGSNRLKFIIYCNISSRFLPQIYVDWGDIKVKACVLCQEAENDKLSLT